MHAFLLEKSQNQTDRLNFATHIKHDSLCHYVCDNFLQDVGGNIVANCDLGNQFFDLFQQHASQVGALNDNAMKALSVLLDHLERDGALETNNDGYPVHLQRFQVTPPRRNNPGVDPNEGNGNN